jgi:MscS family membrane protein
MMRRIVNRIVFFLCGVWLLVAGAACAQLPEVAPLLFGQAEEKGEEPTDAPPEEPTGAPPEDPAEEPAVEIPRELSSARRTMRTFMTAMENDEYFTAAGAVDFSELPEDTTGMQRVAVMRRLKGVIERLAVVDYGEISDDPEGPTYRFPPDQINQPIMISRGPDGVWRFAPESVAKADQLYESLRDKPVITKPRAWYHRELILGNETWRIMTLALGIFLGLIIGQLVRFLLMKVGGVFERRKRPIVAVTFKTIGRFAAPAIFLLGLLSGVEALVLEHNVESLMTTIVRVLFTIVIAYAAYRLVDVVIEAIRDLTRRAGGTLNDMVVPVVGTTLRLLVVVLAFLEIVTYLSDKPPSSVIAGLGIGGLAIGLAAQDTLKNFLGSLAIFLDQPFELGDRIVVDGHDGPVEAVGFRSTRIRTLDGHLVVVPNGAMADKTIHNIGKRPFIRQKTNVRIAYDTPPEKIERALEIIRELLDKHEGMQESHPPRVFLNDFLETSINILIIYWYHPPAYWEFCAFHERFCLEFVKRFKAEGIRFALPAQTLYLAGDPERPLSGDEAGGVAGEPRERTA